METRTIDDVLKRVEEVQEWDISGDRERELMRFVPPDHAPDRHGRYLRDDPPPNRPSPGTPSLRSAPLRAVYLLSEAERRWLSPSPENRAESKACLRRAQEAAWVAGVAEARLEELAGQHEGVLPFVTALRMELGR